MIRLICTGVLLSISVFSHSGCSTMNPFAKEAEDYNRLTYGDDYQGRGGAWAPKKIRLSPNDSERGSVYDEEALGTHSALSRGERQPASREFSAISPQEKERFKKTDFYDDSPHDGSLWSNDLDENYFFTKGKSRGLGDIVSIKAEDSFIKQIAEEIKKTLTPLEQEIEMALYMKANPPGAVGVKDEKNPQAGADRNMASLTEEDLSANGAFQMRERMLKASQWANVDLTKSIGLQNNEEIRAEVIDRFKNGNYKVRAVKRVMYRGTSKLISIVGVAPANDFDEKDAIASGKLYEYRLKVAN